MIGQMPIPDSLALAGWIACAGAVLWGANEAMKFFGRLKETPPPSQTYATKAELKELREDLRQELAGVRSDIGVIRHEMKGDKSEILADGVRRTDQVHERINDLEKEVGTIPNQVIVLLKHTGSLRQ